MYLIVSNSIFKNILVKEIGIEIIRRKINNNKNKKNVWHENYKGEWLTRREPITIKLEIVFLNT